MVFIEKKWYLPSLVECKKKGKLYFELLILLKRKIEGLEIDVLVSILNCNLFSLLLGDNGN